MFTDFLFSFLTPLEPQELRNGNVVLLMQEILNLLNNCYSTQPIITKIMELTFDLLDQMPNAHLLALPTVTAGWCAGAQCVHECCIYVF